MRNIAAVKAAFIAATKTISTEMTAIARADGMSSPSYQKLSDDYRAIRLSFGIAMSPNAPEGWKFLKGRENA